MQQQPSLNYTYSNPPPQQRIITSKDQAIKQLIYQNTYLKRQLSSIMLKASTPLTSAFHSTLNSPVKNKEYSRAQFSSHRNSMERIDVIKVNKFSVNNFSIDQAKAANVPNYRGNQKQGLSCRHSISTDLKLAYSPVTNNKMFVELQNRNLQRMSEYIQTLPVTFNPVRTELKSQKSQPVNNLNLNKTPSTQQKQSNEEELYRYKMMKLKGKKSPRSNHVSQQKHIQDGKDIKSIPIQTSQSITFIQQDQREQLVQAHEVLKSKLNSQSEANSIKVNIKSQVKEAKSQQTDKLNINSSITQLKNIDGSKKIPRYVPKNFSIQKENKERFNPPKQNYFQKQFEKQTEKNSEKKLIKSHLRHNTQLSLQQARKQFQQAQNLSSKQQQKKICLRDLRGHVYLDAQEGSKTRRTISKSNNLSSNNQSVNQLQNTTRNQIKEKQLTKRLNPVYSKAININTDNFDNFNKQSTDASGNNEGKALMRKNSNKVYMQEQGNEQNSLINYGNHYKMEEDKHYPIISKPESTKNIARKSNQEQGISSIEQIHQILQESHLNDNIITSSSKNTPIIKNPSQSHIITSSSVATVSLLKKGLNNQIYYSQQSTTDIK